MNKEQKEQFFRDAESILKEIKRIKGRRERHFEFVLMRTLDRMLDGMYVLGKYICSSCNSKEPYSYTECCENSQLDIKVPTPIHKEFMEWKENR